MTKKASAKLSFAFKVFPPVWCTLVLSLFLGPFGVISRPCVLAPFLPITLLLNSTPDYLIVCWIFPHLPFKRTALLPAPLTCQNQFSFLLFPQLISPWPLLTALPTQILDPPLPSIETHNTTCATPKLPPPPSCRLLWFLSDPPFFVYFYLSKHCSQFSFIFWQNFRGNTSYGVEWAHLRHTNRPSLGWKQTVSHWLLNKTCVIETNKLEKPLVVYTGSTLTIISWTALHPSLQPPNPSLSRQLAPHQWQHRENLH